MHTGTRVHDDLSTVMDWDTHSRIRRPPRLSPLSRSKCLVLVLVTIPSWESAARPTHPGPSRPLAKQGILAGGGIPASALSKAAGQTAGVLCAQNLGPSTIPRAIMRLAM